MANFVTKNETRKPEIPHPANQPDPNTLPQKYYFTHDEELGRAFCIKNMNKPIIEKFHEFEKSIERTLAPFEIVKEFNLVNIFPKFHGVNDPRYPELEGLLKEQRPKIVEPRECIKCGWKKPSTCEEFRNNLCHARYTQIEYRHAWDWNIHHNLHKEEFSNKGRKSKLYNEVEEE